MDETNLIYIILTLFSLNVIGIAGTWRGIDHIDKTLSDLTIRLAVLESQFKIHCRDKE